MITFTEYIQFFRFFDLLMGGQTDRPYWIHWIILTFRLFDLFLGGQNDDFTEYIYFCRLLLILMKILIFFDFSTFRSLGVWSK